MSAENERKLRINRLFSKRIVRGENPIQDESGKGEMTLASGMEDHVVRVRGILAKRQKRSTRFQKEFQVTVKLATQTAESGINFGRNGLSHSIRGFYRGAVPAKMDWAQNGSHTKAVCASSTVIIPA